VLELRIQFLHWHPVFLKFNSADGQPVLHHTHERFDFTY
jgi:hypothetical protein